MKKESLRWKLILVLTMVIFATITLTASEVNSRMSTGEMCLFRGFGGAIMVFLLRLLTGKLPDIQKIWKNFALLALSGIFLGLNWAMLFMSYRYMDVSICTLCNYLAPMAVILVSPFIFREKLTLGKALCALLAFFGMALASGVLTNGSVFTEGQNPAAGFTYGFLGMAFYALMYILNKKVHDVSGFDRALVQLFFGGLVMIPYIFIAEGGFQPISFDGKTVLYTVIIAFVQTGVVYFLYDSCVEHVSAQTTSLFSYIDPALSVVLCLMFLPEKPSVPKIVGAVIIIGAALLSEFIDGFFKGRKPKKPAVKET